MSDIRRAALDLLGPATGTGRARPVGVGVAPPRAAVSSERPRPEPLLAAAPGERPVLGLAMIVRDEAAVIERCLESVRHLIGVWLIVDTGSTDATRELITRSLDGIPGVLAERPWRDFGWNRTELLGLARGMADYLLLLDADMTVVDDGFDTEHLVADMHEIIVRDGYEYRMPYVAHGDVGFWYEGRTHEYLARPDDVSSAYLDSLAIDHHGDGGTRPEKFTRDLELLELDITADPDNPRWVFYLAQTRHGLGDVTGALAAYRAHAEMSGWDEEVFWSLYQCGRLLDASGEWVHAAQAYLSAWEFRPQRAEPLYRLAVGYRLHDHHRVAMHFAALAVALDVPADRLFVERWVYDWGARFELSVALGWTGRLDEAIDHSEVLLALGDRLDGEHRRALEHNLAVYRAARD